MDQLTELYQVHFQRVWHALRFAGIRAADLDDLTHDVFLVVGRKLLASEAITLPPDASPEERERAWGAWIRQIAFYEASNYRRRAINHRQELMDNIDEVPDQQDDRARLEARDKLLLLLSHTTPERQAVLMLVEVERCTVNEAAEILAISEALATRRLRRAREDLEAAAVKLQRREEASGAPRRSGVYLLPFGVGAWVKLRVLLDPPPGTKERIWERLQSSMAKLDAEPQASPSPPSPPRRLPFRARLRSLAGPLKAVFGHLVSAAVGAAIAAWLLWPRPSAAVPAVPPLAPLSVATSSPQAPALPPSSTVIDIHDLPFADPLTPPVASAAEATLVLEEEARLIRQAHSAYTGGDVAATMAALNAYDLQFPAGQLKKDAQALRKRAQRPRR